MRVGRLAELAQEEEVARERGERLVILVTRRGGAGASALVVDLVGPVGGELCQSSEGGADFQHLVVVVAVAVAAQVVLVVVVAVVVVVVVVVWHHRRHSRLEVEPVEIVSPQA